MSVCPNCGGDFAGPEGFVDSCSKCGWRPGGVDEAQNAAWQEQQRLLEETNAAELGGAANQASQQWLAEHTAEDLAALQAAEAARITEPTSPVQVPGG